MMKKIPRWIASELLIMMKVQRIVSVIGARQSGKTTLLELIDIPHAKIVTMDLQENADAARNDPHFFLRQVKKGCLVIDEFQKVPELIGTMKYIVDHDLRKGQFIITGSTDYRKLPQAKESLAGRVGMVRVQTFTEAEKRQARPNFLERMFSGDFPSDVNREECNKKLILDLAIRGGFPEILNASIEERVRWFKSYITQQIILDMRDQWGIRKLSLAEDMIKYIAAYSSKPFVIETVKPLLGVARMTIDSYLNAIEAMHLCERLNA